VYPTYEALDYCIPTAEALNNVYSKSADSTFSSSNYYVSMYESRWVVLTCVFISLVIALIYIKLMDWFAVTLAWITIVVIEVALCLMGYFAYAYSNKIENTHNGESTGQSEALLWTGIVLWMLAAVYYLIMCCNFRSLKISIAIIETAADFFADTKRIALVPLFYFCIWCGIFVAWLWALAGIASISSTEIVPTSATF